MKPLDLRDCKQCGQPFQPQHYLSRYCHPACKARADNIRKLAGRQPRTFACPECGEQARTWNVRQVTCGRDQCSADHRAAQRAAYDERRAGQVRGARAEKHRAVRDLLCSRWGRRA